jgi:hypothetical protein
MFSYSLLTLNIKTQKFKFRLAFYICVKLFFCHARKTQNRMLREKSDCKRGQSNRRMKKTAYKTDIRLGNALAGNNYQTCLIPLHITLVHEHC